MRVSPSAGLGLYIYFVADVFLGSFLSRSLSMVASNYYSRSLVCILQLSSGDISLPYTLYLKADLYSPYRFDSFFFSQESLLSVS